MKIRVTLFAASPVNYQAPLYRLLAKDPRLDFRVLFASDEGARRPLDNEYGTPVEWESNSLEGYKSTFLRHASQTPHGGNTFSLRDPTIVPTLWRSNHEVLWLHGYHTVTHFLAAITQKTKGRPLLYREEQNLLTPRAQWKTALKTAVLRPLLSGSYGLYIGSKNRQWFERWGVPPERLFHVPYVANVDPLLDGASVSSAEAKASFDISPKDGPVLLFVGRLMAKKQPIQLVEAFGRVRQRHRCVLLIAGSGEHERSMREKVEQAGIPDVIFAGFLNEPQLGRAYRAADALVLPSAFDETWGLVVNEAMSFALPVLASDRVGSAYDLIRPGDTGFTFRHDDVGDLIEKMECLVTDRSLRAEMGRQATATVEDWSYEAAASGGVAAIRAAVGETRWREVDDTSAPPSRPALA